MPAVVIGENQRREKRVAKREEKLQSYIRELLRTKHKKQVECAEVLGITQAAFSAALKSMSFSVTRLMVLLDFLGADPEEVAMILARE